MTIPPSDPTQTAGTIDLTSLLHTVSAGRDLAAAEAEALFDRFMTGAVSPPLMAAFLMGLQTKGVRPAEVAGGVRALRRAMVPVGSRDAAALVDTAGTGGGGVTTFNISTAAALVAAGAGVRLAKHGNRSFTSRSGSADVLEALGVRIDLTPESMAEILEEVGIVFMFAPLLHPAMRHVGPVRRELGVPTIMNLLGPLTNPAGASRQVVGVSDPALLDLIAEALAELGHERALVVHGEPGMDEVSPCGPTTARRVSKGKVEPLVLDPEELGVGLHPIEDLAGGEPEENAAVVRGVLAGNVEGGARAAVVLNAAAAIHVSDESIDFPTAIEKARETVASGAAMDTLRRLVDATRRAASG